MTIELADGTKLRREFKLPEEDVECLDALGFKWETVIEGGTKWLIIHGYPIPDGYNHGTADLALRIPPSYPDDQIDMVYFSPALALTSGKAIRQLSAADDRRQGRTSSGRVTGRRRTRGAPASTMSARICSRSMTGCSAN